LLAALWVAQSIARVLFSRATINIARADIAIHIMLLVAALGGIAFIVALFPDTPRGRRHAAFAGVALLAPLHAVTTLFDVSAVATYRLTGLTAPFALIRSAPALLLSLLNSIGLDPATVALIIAGMIALHVLLYLPVAALLVDIARRVMAWRLAAGRSRGLALRWLVVPGLGLVLLLHQPYVLLWFHNEVFVIAPEALMSGEGTPSTARLPERDLPGARPLILVVVDALRRDRMGLYDPALANTPFLTGLAAQGTLQRFDPSFGTCTFSYCGIMSVLSSHSWDDFGQRPATIIDALGRYHYRSYVMMVGGNSRYSNIVTNFGGPIFSLHDEIPQFGARADDRHVAAMVRATRFPDPRHSFVYIHLMSTHAGSLLQPAFLAAARDDARRLPYALSYDARVRQADAVLRDLFAALRERGLGDALVVITGDHGERLGEGGRLFHGGDPDPAVLAAPLIVYDPRGATWPAHAIVSQIDIAPTLLAAAGAPPQPEWRGIALQDATARPAVPIATSDTVGLVGIVAGQQVEYRCERKNGHESIQLLDGHGGGIALPRARAPRLIALLRGWEKNVSPAMTGRCRH
jgi:hypothetical protein